MAGMRKSVYSLLVLTSAQNTVAASQCTDQTTEYFGDAHGEDCSYYVDYHLCTADGGYGVMWDSAYGTFSDWPDSNGLTADVACCGCGGGAAAGPGANTTTGTESTTTNTTASSMSASAATVLANLSLSVPSSCGNYGLEPAMSSVFELSPELWNGRACWQRAGRGDTDLWLYTNNAGHWEVGTDEQRRRNNNVDTLRAISSVAAHNGLLPQEMDAWQFWNVMHINYADWTNGRWEPCSGVRVGETVAAPPMLSLSVPDLAIPGGGFGIFELYSVFWNGMPCWRRGSYTGESRLWLYSTSLGTWMVSTPEGRRTEVGYISNNARHSGAMPDEVNASAWQRVNPETGEFVSAPDLRVARGEPEAPPPALSLSVPSSSDCPEFSGRFELHSELWNGMPRWRRTTRYEDGNERVSVYLYNSGVEHGKWSVGLHSDMVNEVSEGHFGGIRSIAPHRGAMPEEVDAWECHENVDDGEDWVSRPRLQFATITTTTTTPARTPERSGSNSTAMQGESMSTGTVFTGSFELTMSSADALEIIATFSTNNAVRTALQGGIASGLGIPSSMVEVTNVSTRTGRRLAAATSSVQVDYTITVPTGSSTTLAASDITGATTALKDSINAAMTAASLSYAVTAVTAPTPTAETGVTLSNNRTRISVTATAHRVPASCVLIVAGLALALFVD